MNSSRFFFYADEESAGLLASAKAKALLIGGDFGYGNFGDVLQHIGAARHAKGAAELAVVSVFVLDALSRHVDPVTLRKRYPVDALLFTTEVPIDQETASALGLRLVSVLRNVSLVHLYGGGYLNALWGGFVLALAEHFLRQLPEVPYVMSGQQLSSGFEPQSRAHVETFRPRLVGMRDQLSLARACAAGIPAEFSFDDAVEPLLSLRTKLALRDGDGAFIHLNTSGYTGNEEALSEMVVHLRGVAARIGGLGRPVLLQAFQDAREDVVDTIETVKRLETGFPFSDAETALLVHAVLDDERRTPRILQGRFGYSSSYHVTLWLQLNGIPCWLRGSNDYYQQKRRALGIEGRFEEFLECKQPADHDGNLRRRAQWLSRLQQVLGSTKAVENRIEWSAPDHGTAVRTFRFKGEPRFEQQLRAAWTEQEHLHLALGEAHAGQREADAQSRSARVALDEARIALQLAQASLVEANARLEAVLAQNVVVGNELERRTLELEGAQGRLQACAEHITELGSQARHFRDAFLHADAHLQQVELREREATARLQEVLGSRSWRWTLPLRAGSRFLRTGRLDSAGQVGWFAIARAIGRQLPIPAKWRTAIGLRLQRLRRR